MSNQTPTTTIPNQEFVSDELNNIYSDTKKPSDFDMSHIVSIEVKRLWGEIDINWILDPKVNILIGKNGTGKTILLHLIEAAIRGVENFNETEFKSIQLKFNSNKQITVHRTIDPSTFFAEAFSEEQKTPKEKEHLDLLKQFLSAVAKDDKFGGAYSVDTNLISKQEKENMDSMDFSHIINLAKISTFELSLSALKPTQDKRNSQIKTELDIILADLIERFKGYQLKLRNLEKNETASLDQKIKALSAKETAEKAELEELRRLIADKDKKITEIYQQKNDFINQVNTLFSDARKTLDFDENNALIFQKSQNHKLISPYQLSSGEKQVLIILLTTILQENKPSIILMDEPEISLHLSWQLYLIDVIQKLNPNCQLIIVTHSPGIFTRGWKDKITKMENIIME
jgi:predicted ATP-dependent endonuclease of OLD family